MPYYVHDKIISPNIWDEQWEVGAISNATGENTSSDIRIRSKGYIEVSPNTNYYYYFGGNNWLVVFYYDKDKNYITYVENSTSLARQTPSNCKYVRFYAFDSTYNHNICINVSNPSINGNYYPYNLGCKRYLIKDNNKSMNIGG